MKMTLEQFISSAGLSMTTARTSSNPNMDRDAHMTRHFLCTLKTADGGEMEVPFSQGSAHTSDPTIEDVLDCLASDSATAQESFESWCSELGYDSDSRRAESIYDTCREQHEQLSALLGNAQCEALMYEVERK